MGNTFCIFGGCVGQASVGVIERWGRFDRVAEPGLHFFNPFSGEWLAGVLSTRISSLDVRIETKTKEASANLRQQWRRWRRRRRGAERVGGGSSSELLVRICFASDKLHGSGGDADLKCGGGCGDGGEERRGAEERSESGKGWRRRRELRRAPRADLLGLRRAPARSGDADLPSSGDLDSSGSINSRGGLIGGREWWWWW